MLTNDFLRLLMVSSLVCGLEFCTASAFTYIPPILLKAGLRESSMSWLMGCGPLLGFLLCPVIGHASDRCRSSYGRRRPFILAFSCIIIFGLLVIPFSESIGRWIHVPKLGLLLLIISCVLFDFSSQACLNPCEALIYDLCQGTSQENSCFFVYSFMTSFGGCLGYLITATNWTDSFLNAIVQGQERLTFMIILIFFLLTLSCTLLVANEKVYLHSEAVKEKTTFIDDVSTPFNWVRWSFSILFDSVRTILTMPLVLRRLTLAECCSWSALMTFNLFFSDFVGQTVYLGNPGAEELTVERLQYDQGVRAASYGLLFHCLVAALFAPCLRPLLNRFGIHRTFSFTMIVFAGSMLGIYFSRNIIVINIMASLTGLCTAALTSIPYTLVVTYHTNSEVYFVDNPVIQTRGIGSVLGILDSTYFASQILASIMMGYIMLIFQSPLAYIGTSLILAMCSIWFIRRIVINREQLQQLLQIDC